MNKLFVTEKFTPTPWGRMRSRTICKSENAKIHIVLVPGMIISSDYMVPLARQLAPYAVVHLVDFPGYGKSEKPKHVLNLAELAETLRIWMQENGLEKANFVGNSFGCQILAEFATRYPHLVEKLILQGPTVDPSARSFWKQAIRMWRNSKRESKSVGIISLKDYRAAGLKRVCATIRMTLKDRIEDRLPKIRAKTLVVRGDLDPMVPQAWAEEAAKLIPNGELAVIKGGAHTLNYSEPEKFSKVIAKFLGLRE